MRRLLRDLNHPHDERLALISDALGTVALFVLLAVALHLPLMT